jgi:hypothetical protein
VYADLDGDGELETVIGQGNQTTVLKNDHVLWTHIGPIDGWNRGDDDTFYPADIDGDHRQEIVVADNVDRWTGVFKWDGVNLRTVWGSSSPLQGAAGGWFRGIDVMIPYDIDGDGRTEVFIANNVDEWTGVLKWDGSRLGPVWMSPSPITGPGGKWTRRSSDAFLGESDGIHISYATSTYVSTAILGWYNGALVPVKIDTTNFQYWDTPISLNRSQTSNTWVGEAPPNATASISSLSWNAGQTLVQVTEPGQVVHLTTGKEVSVPQLENTDAFNGDTPAGKWQITLGSDSGLPQNATLEIIAVHETI